MKKHVDYQSLIGHEFGRLTVSAVLHRNKRHEMVLSCRCSCGGTVGVPYPRLKSGNTKSCGCLQPEVIRALGKLQLRHGDVYTTTYRSWRNMVRRCYEPNNISYPNYGKIGITVCDEWRASYAAFKRDMGPRPDGKTLDRFPNPTGNYEPGNCRWATPKQQARNVRTNHWITLGGKTQIVQDWASEVGVSATTILDRLGRGWTEERAVLTPTLKGPPQTFEVGGRMMTVSEIGIAYGVDQKLIRGRLQRGVSILDAIASPSKQIRKRGTPLAALGRSMTIKEWSRHTGIPYHTILARLSMGWSPDDAVTRSVQLKTYTR